MNPRRLRVALAPSPVLASAIVVLHAAAGICVLAVMPSFPGSLLAALLLALGLATAWSRALLRSRSSVRTLELDGAKLELRLAGGESFAAELAEHRYVTRFMVILVVLRPMRRSILVTRDMLGEDLFRQLRIWALWGKLPGVAPKQLPL